MSSRYCHVSIPRAEAEHPTSPGAPTSLWMPPSNQVQPGSHLQHPHSHTSKTPEKLTVTGSPHPGLGEGWLSLRASQVSESCSVVSDSLQPHGLYTPWSSLGQNTRVGSLSLLQGIFPTQGSNPGLPHCRQILYQLSHQGSIPEDIG